jgi:hypothetical protein
MRTKMIAASSTIACALVTGCAVQTGEPSSGAEGDVGKTSEPLSGLITATWGGVGSSFSAGTDQPFFTNGAPAFLDLNIADGWTCWLAGVSGNLVGGVGGTVGVGRNYQGLPQVHVTNWYLQVTPAAGQALEASAVCAPSTATVAANQNAGQIGGQQPGPLFTQVILGPQTSQGQFCGLGELFPNGPGSWTSGASSLATVSNNGTNPDDVFTSGTWTWSQEHAGSGVQCAKATTSFMFDWNIVAPASGTVTMPLGAMPAGTVCFLSSVTGSFASNDFGDGVSVSFANGKWSMTASNGKRATATCFD